jgi:hypothetical protein
VKICWDNLEKIKYIKSKGLWFYHRNYYKYIEFCKTCGEPFLGCIGNNNEFCSRDCVRHEEESIRKISRVKTGTVLSEETRRKLSMIRYGVSFSTEHKEKIRNALLGKKHTRERIEKTSGEKHFNWKGGVKAKNIALFDTYAHQISWCESVRRDPEDEKILNVKCTYCGKWYRPSLKSIRTRIDVVNGTAHGDCRLYCSSGCKRACPIFHKVKYSEEEHHINILVREIQAELRQLVFARDEWACIKCGATCELHCHHIEGIRWNPLESADMDLCVTLCKPCHEEIHKQKGCGYYDLKCNNLLTNQKG